MNVELTGPDDLGFWFLVDKDGNAFPFVERHEDHPRAAKLFGWEATDGANRKALIQDAIDFLMEHIGDQIEAPPEAVDYFNELNAEE